MGRRYGADNQTVGAKLAPRIALLVGQIMQDHVRRTAGHRAQIGADAAVKFFQTIERERNVHAAPLLNLWLGHDATHYDLEHLLRFVHHGSGELSSLLSQGALSAAVGNSIGSGLANLLAPANQAIMFGDPAQILDPGTMASLAAGRVVSDNYAQHIARMSGIPEQASAYLIEAAHSFPPLALALDLWRRGGIDQAAFEHILRRQAMPEAYIGAIMKLRQQLLAPADLALMVLKGIRTEEQVRGEASAQGIDAARLSELVQMTGEPLGLQQLQEAFRRGYIDRQRLEHGIRQSRVRDEWTDVVLKLRYQRASPSDALRGVVQNHLTSAQGKAIAEENGLDPRDWDWLVETEGNPAATGQMIQLWNRGVVDQAHVEQAIRESRVKNKYIPALLHLRRRLPAERQIVNMVTRGSIDDVRAAKLFHELGYDTAIAQALVHAASSSQVVREKELAKSEVEELYYDLAISHAEAEQLLRALGYSAHNATFLLHLVTLKREKALRQAAMAPIRSAYIARHIDESEAKTQLDQIGIPHEQRDLALHLWTVDRAAHRKVLTEAQIVKANENGLLADAAAEQRLEHLGYTHEDSRILLDLEKGRRHAAP